MSEQNGPRGPIIVELDKTSLPDAPSPAEAPPPADLYGDGVQNPPAVTRAIMATTGGRGFGLGRLLVFAIAALATLWIGIAIENLIADLFAAQGWLGWLGLAIVGLVVLILLLIALREVAALARLGRIEHLRRQAEEAVETGSTHAASEVLGGLNRLYRGRADLEWQRRDLMAALDDTP
ncbi:MAG: hypothetical protein AAF439_07070, partial [Pseudomonadota bacterium]